jgi:hypothetical protein
MGLLFLENDYNQDFKTARKGVAVVACVARSCVVIRRGDLPYRGGAIPIGGTARWRSRAPRCVSRLGRDAALGPYDGSWGVMSAFSAAPRRT